MKIYLICRKVSLTISKYGIGTPSESEKDNKVVGDPSQESIDDSSIEPSQETSQQKSQSDDEQQLDSKFSKM